jgi:oligopeptide transport system substrate-binding protein
MTRYEDYNLRDKAAVNDVTFKIYQQDTAAYNDLISNNLDFMEQIPTSMLAGDKWKQDLGDRAKQAPIPSTALIAFPFYDKRFQDKNLRKAIALAIDREAINEKIHSGTRPAAHMWSSPLTPGGKPNECTICKYDPEQAKALLQQAGGFEGELVFYYNADSSHKEWMDAVANSVKNVLGINARAEGVPTFAVFRQQVNAHKMKGPYRAAWQQDYPSVENWIGPLYVTGGSSNDGLYSNKEVDALYKQATAAKSEEEAYAIFSKIIDILNEEVPSIPVYHYSEQYGYSTKIKSVEVTNVGEIDLSSVELA